MTPRGEAVVTLACALAIIIFGLVLLAGWTNY